MHIHLAAWSKREVASQSKPLGSIMPKVRFPCRPSISPTRCFSATPELEALDKNSCPWVHEDWPALIAKLSKRGNFMSHRPLSACSMTAILSNAIPFSARRITAIKPTLLSTPIWI